MPAWIWLLLGISAMGLETMRGDFYLLPIGIAALVAALFASAPSVAVLTFVAVSAVLVFGVRPRWMRRWMAASGRSPSQQFIGRTARVVRAIVPDQEFSGAVELDGRRYTAYALMAVPIAAGTSVEVMAVEGIQLVVHPVDQPLTSGLPSSLHR